MLHQYPRYDATGLAALIRNRDISTEELLQATIARIERLNPKFNAVVEQLYDSARAQIASGLPTGPFTGLPILIKDLHTLVKGSRLTQGCRFFQSNVSTIDSHLVSQFRDAGFIVIGRTNTPEFGLNTTTEGRFHGPARNPWNSSLSCGGSSGGSAVAVASGMTPVAHATDSGGSIRIPASCCGLVGLKLSRGRIFAGLDIGESWNDVFHAFALTRSVRDTATLLDYLTNTDTPSPYRAPPQQGTYADFLHNPFNSLLIGVMSSPASGVPVHPDCLTALEDVRTTSEMLGHKTEDIRITFDSAALSRAFVRVISASVAATVAHWEQVSGNTATEQEFEASVWQALQVGKNINGAELCQANATLHLLSQQIVSQLHRFDVVMSPTLALPPLPLGTLDAGESDLYRFLEAIFRSAPFTSIYNVTGLPACSLPLHWNATNLPIGIQFAAAWGREDILVSLAAQLEEAKPWRAKQLELIDRL